MKKYLKTASIAFIIISLILIAGTYIFLSNINELTNNQINIISITISNLIVTTLIWIGASAIVIFLWIKFPWEKYPVKHLILELTFLTCWSIIVFMLTSKISARLVPVNIFKITTGNLLLSCLITYFITSVHEAVLFYKQWIRNFNKSIKLEKANLQAKYEALKTQINPHFLFNSLSTLLNYVDDNPRAVEYIQNLSDFMRYLLENRKNEIVLLEDEITISKKYCYLQESRFGNNLSVNFDIPEKYNSYSIIPLAIQMLIENAIKHNVISKEKSLSIAVYIKDGDYLYVENNLQKKNIEESTRIGLANIIERYRFLSAKEIKITQSSGKFVVALPLVKINL